MEARRLRPPELRVPELRDQLGRRGLDTRGLKAEMAEGLQAALDSEGTRRGDAEGRCKRDGGWRCEGRDGGGCRCEGWEMGWALRARLGASRRSGGAAGPEGLPGREPPA